LLFLADAKPAKWLTQADKMGESAALPLPLLQIAAVTVGLPQYSFYYCRCMVSLPLC
jgi:hypothetical protein